MISNSFITRLKWNAVFLSKITFEDEICSDYFPSLTESYFRIPKLKLSKLNLGLLQYSLEGFVEFSELKHFWKFSQDVAIIFSVFPRENNARDRYYLWIIKEKERKKLPFSLWLQWKGSTIMIVAEKSIEFK